MLTYDDVYRKPDFYWGRSPNRMCETATNLFPADERTGKQVIDLGCGEGRDLIHFARAGIPPVRTVRHGLLQRHPHLRTPTPAG